MSRSRRSKTGRRISVTPRGQTPGLKCNLEGRPYWIARQLVRDPLGFPDACVPLPAEADATAIAELCQQYTAQLFAWIDQERSTDGPPLPAYDGTVYSACQCYQRHPLSRFHSVKANTRKGYTDSLKVIESTVGKRLIKKVTILDVMHWYTRWREPAEKTLPDGTRIVGNERIDRAHERSFDVQDGVALQCRIAPPGL